jgi:hypothetical protein
VAGSGGLPSGITFGRGGDGRLTVSARLASLRVSRLTAGTLLVLCFAAGYLFAGWLSGARDTTPLARICSRVDYVNGLQEHLEGQQAAVPVSTLLGGARRKRVEAYETLQDGGRRGLRLTFEDKGPGVPNIQLALMDGYTTGSGLGLGLERREEARPCREPDWTTRYKVGMPGPSPITSLHCGNHPQRNVIPQHGVGKVLYSHQWVGASCVRVRTSLPPWMAHNRPAPPGCARGRARLHPNRLAAFQPNSAARPAQFSPPVKKLLQSLKNWRHRCGGMSVSGRWCSRRATPSIQLEGMRRARTSAGPSSRSRASA